MASSSMLVLFLVLSVSSTSAAAAETPKVQVKQAAPGAGICPLTGQLPTKPDSAPPRCQSSSELTCCTACQTASTALNVVAKNGTSLLGFVGLIKDPSLAPFISSFTNALGNKQLCSLFEGHDQCLGMIEALYCGMSCDAQAGGYLTVDSTKANGTLKVCNAFATKLYGACSTIKVPGFNAPLSQYVDSPVTLFAMIVGPLIKTTTSLSTLDITIDTSGVQQVVPTCFAGPATYPKKTVCCDTLSSTPQKCFVSGAIPSTEQSLVNRTLPGYCPATPGAGSGSPSSTTNNDGQHSKGAAASQGASLALVASAFVGLAALLSF